MNTDCPAGALEHHFREIERLHMAGMSILNPALSVQAVGFERREQGWVGVLIAPWFISLFLVPDDEPANLVAGSTQSHRFPSGSHDFVVAHDNDIGCYQTRSLMSPVFELVDQGAAIAFAEAALQALYQAGGRAGSPAGQVSSSEPPAPSAPGPAPEPVELSRRAFLFGRRPGVSG